MIRSNSPVTAQRIGRVAAALGAAALVTVLLASPARARERQAQNLFLPNVSPFAEVTQTIGMTDITVSYHRPAVNGRDLWGEGNLVPYGQVWRTGANENTLIRFTSDVTIEGQPLAAGTYSLHTIPGPDEWTIIFNRDVDAWGSFNYDPERDALRVTVEPSPGPHRERLAFSFDGVTSDSATVALHWGELQVGFDVGVDSHHVTMESIRAQLKGLAGFFWQAWNQAANYTLTAEKDLDQGLEWADQSIAIQPDFANYQTKAQILTALGRDEEADEVMASALPMGNAGQLHNYGRQLIAAGEPERALEIFQRNAEQNPGAWFIGVGLARGYSALGRFDEAAAGMKDAMEKAPENQQQYLQGLLDQLESGEDIN